MLAADDAGGVRHQIFDRDRPHAAAAFEGDIAELGDVFRDGIVHRELAFILQNHHGGRGDGFGHGGDGEQRIGLHGFFIRDVGLTDRAQVHDLAVFGDQSHHAGGPAFFHVLFHPAVDGVGFVIARVGGFSLASACDGDEILGGIFGEHQAAEADFLGDFVGVQLQADGAGFGRVPAWGRTNRRRACR